MTDNGARPAIEQALAADNLALALALSQNIVADAPQDGFACAVIARIAGLVGLTEAETRWASRADRSVLRDLREPANGNVIRLLAGCAPAGTAECFLVVRAWGYGLWAEAHNVLGNILLAELSGRIPIVYWGDNSLFLPEGEANAFPLIFNGIGGEHFEMASSAPDGDVFPAKWHGAGLGGAARDTRRPPHRGGEGSMAALWLLNRPEKIVVSDYFIGVAELMPWIPEDHRFFGCSIEEIVRTLSEEALAPNWRIRDAVAEAAEKLAGEKTVAVHIRGGDKGVEVSRLDELNSHYPSVVEQAVEHGYVVWLMTDTEQIAQSMKARFGEAVRCQDALRTADRVGVHYSRGPEDRVRLAEEVVTDVLVGASCDRFVGNGASAPSCMVDFLMEGDETRKHLFLPNQYRRRLISLYRD